jgi:peptidoglycan hydrolase-like protein with peptidoglycan-binding domain
MEGKERVIIMAIPAYYSLLHRGSSGPDVALVQTWLNGVRDACTWHDPLKADGRFGLSTENAVKEFQLKNKMNVDGKVGANTWNVLYTQYTAKHGLNVPYPGIVLRSGASGGTVRLVQQKLNTEGERLTTDGKFGASTVAAVKRYQTRHNLTSDGSVGKDTWEKMFPAA